MDEFYKELKALRERQNIDLAEIQNRTKINLRFLEAFEEGNFDVLPKTYVRLFLRAYVAEIGGNPEEVLTQFEHYLSFKAGQPIEKKSAAAPKVKTATAEAAEPPRKIRFSTLPYRSNLIKGGILLIIWIFAIFIIQKIVRNEESLPKPIPAAVYLTNDMDIITEDILKSDFTVLTSDETTYTLIPPLSLKVITTEPTGYRVKIDTTEAMPVALPSGDQRTYAFEKELDLLFNHSRGLNVFVNGTVVRKIETQNDPVRIHVTSDPSKITVVHFTPLN